MINASTCTYTVYNTIINTGAEQAARVAFTFEHAWPCLAPNYKRVYMYCKTIINACKYTVKLL